MISANILMQRLGENRFDSKKMIRQRWFKRIILAIGDEIPYDLTAHNPAGVHGNKGLTLVCGNRETTSFSFLLSPDVCILYVANNTENIPPWINQSEKCLVYRTNNDAAHVCRKAQQVLFEIDSWTSMLKGILIENGDYQKLLDCSEGILGNFITITNADFRFLAHTQHIAIDDPALDYAMKFGHHSEEMIGLFRKYRITQYWEVQSKIEEKPASEMNKYPVLDYIFHMQGKYFIHVIMHCNNFQPNSALIDLFQILIDHISHQVKKDWREGLSLESGPSDFFSELISNTGFTEKELERKLVETKIPMQSNFVLYVFNFVSDVSNKSLLAYYSRKLSELFPQYRIGIFGQQILVLDFKKELSEQDMTLMKAFAEEVPCLIGVSDRFSRITDFPFAFQQADYAINGIRKGKQTLGQYYANREDSPFRYYGRSFCSFAAENAWQSSNLIRYSLDHGIVADIVAYDNIHGTNDSKILYYYLIAERNASKASRMLFINRSTLVYRIESLQSRFDVNLDDFSIRQRIISEYMLFPVPEMIPKAETRPNSI